MALTQEQADAVEREIKSLSGSLGEFTASVTRDLQALRDYAAQKARDVAADTKHTLEQVFATKFEACQALIDSIKARTDQIETALRRPGQAPGTRGPDDRKLADALAFYSELGAVKGKLRVCEKMDPDSIDLGAFERYGHALDALIRKGPNGMEPGELKDLTSGVDPQGGYWVLPAMSQRIQSIIRESSPIRQVATVETISTDALEFPIDDNEAGAGWAGEVETPTTTATPEIGQGRIAVMTQWAKPRATQQFLEDASINAEQWLSGKIGEKFARLEATAFVLGNGVKQPRGLLTYDAGVGRGKVQQVASGAAATWTADVIKRIPYLIKEPYMQRGSWLMNRTSVAAIATLKEDDTTGAYLWRPGLEQGGSSQLVGFPLRMAADVPALAAGVLGGMFGDFAAAYTIVDRLGITVLRDPYSAKPFVEFYSRRRVGGDVVNFEAYIVVKIAASL